MKTILLKITGIGCIALIAGLFFTGCVQEGSNNYYYQTNNTEKCLTQAFNISSFNEKKVNLYLSSLTTPYATDLPVFMPVDSGTEISDVPYVNFSDCFILYTGVALDAAKNSDGSIQFTRQSDKYYVVFDEQKQTLYFKDYNAFIKKSSASSTLIFAVSPDGKYVATNGENFERYGNEITISFKKYGIQFKVIDNAVYVPLQVINDLFGNGFNLVYNKNGVYATSLMTSDYYDSDSGKDGRSSQLVNFTYNELCLNLDVNYGLKSIHDIADFDTFLNNTGLADKIKGTAKETAYGIKDLTKNYFSDFHSGFLNSSYYAGNYNPVVPDNPVRKISVDLCDYYKKIRDTDNVSSYSSANRVTVSDDTNALCDYAEWAASDSGTADTAYVTFDHFVTASGTNTDYFALTENGTKELSLNNVKDTVGLVIYAHQQIKKNQNIKNVVIDLSCNGGGAANALAYICSWYLGSCRLNLKNALTGAMASTGYKVDVDLNGIMDESDTLQGLKCADGTTARNLKLYCIISPASFSCGNALPAMFKDNGKVTLIGKKSGGGACVVLFSTAADGTYFQMSSTQQISTVKNGSFYQVDEGIDPDFSISDFNNVYNRQKLTEYISSLK